MRSSSELPVVTLPMGLREGGAGAWDGAGRDWAGPEEGEVISLFASLVFALYCSAAAAVTV